MSSSKPIAQRRTRILRAANEAPPFREFASRRFAVRGPFWSWTIFERIGGTLAYGLARLGVPPNAVTLLGGVCGVSGAVALGLATTPSRVLGALTLLLLAYSLDCADGQLARATGRASPQGAWLDVTVDSIVVAFLAASLTFALLTGVGSAPSLLLGGAFGASRTANLFTSTMIRRESGGMKLSGLRGRARAAFTATIDTPFVYVALCATRLAPGLLASVMLGLAVLTAIQTLVSARHHFASEFSPRG